MVDEVADMVAEVVDMVVVVVEMQVVEVVVLAQDRVIGVGMATGEVHMGVIQEEDLRVAVMVQEVVLPMVEVDTVLNRA